MTTFEYLIKTRKEESSKHQVARKDPCAQIEDGFLQVLLVSLFHVSGLGQCLRSLCGWHTPLLQGSAACELCCECV